MEPLMSSTSDTLIDGRPADAKPAPSNCDAICIESQCSGRPVNGSATVASAKEGSKIAVVVGSAKPNEPNTFS